MQKVQCSVLLQTLKALNTGRSDAGITAKLKLLQYTNLLPKQKSSIIILEKSSSAPTYVTNQDRKMRLVNLSAITL